MRVLFWGSKRLINLILLNYRRLIARILEIANKIFGMKRVQDFLKLFNADNIYLSELNAAFSVKRIDNLIGDSRYYNITPSVSNYVTFNPSIAVDKSGDLICVATQTNRKWNKIRKSSLLDHHGYRSRIILINLRKDVSIRRINKIRGLSGNSSHEYSDARLFRFLGNWNISYSETKIDNHICYGRIMISALDDFSINKRSTHRLNSQFLNNIEKNWMPICDENLSAMRFVYSVSPTVVVESQNGEVNIVSSCEGPRDLINARGGSQLVPIGKNYWIAVVHHTYEFDRRYYTHRFVAIEYRQGKYVISGYSPQFNLHAARDVEFAAGLAVMGEAFYISYGYRDNEAWILRLPKEKVLNLIMSI